MIASDLPFEVWQNLAEPMVLMVFRESESFPAPFAARDWAPVGQAKVTDAVAADVDRQGFVTLKTGVPFDPNQVLGAG